MDKAIEKMNEYREKFLEVQLDAMNLTLTNPGFVGLAQSVADCMAFYKDLSFIDYGCGTGVYSEVLRRNGFDIKAYDLWEVHRIYCRENYPELDVIDKPCKSDVMLFIEVAEHMADYEIYYAIKAINPEIILFSSTPYTTDNDLEWGHINIKSKDDWIEMFLKLNYSHVLVNTPTEWSILFTKI